MEKQKRRSSSTCLFVNYSFNSIANFISLFVMLTVFVSIFFFFLVIICICYDTTLLATQHIYIRNPHSGKVSNKTKICKDRSWYALKLNSGDKGVQLRNCYDQILHVFFQGFRSNGPIVTPLPMSLPPFTLTF